MIHALFPPEVLAVDTRAPGSPAQSLGLDAEMEGRRLVHDGLLLRAIAVPALGQNPPTGW